MFPRINRLTGEKSFEEVKKEGRFVNNSVLSIGVLKVSGGVKIGVIASKNFSRKAVDRNKARRMIKNAFNPFIKRIKGDYNILLIAGKDLFNEERDALKLRIENNLKKLELIK